MASATLDRRALAATLKTTILALEWSVGVAMFGAESVVVSNKPADLVLRNLLSWHRPPFVQISLQNGTADEDDPGLEETNLSVVVFSQDKRDDTGETAIMGASDERGLLHVARAVRLAIQALGKTTVPIISVAGGDGQTPSDDAGIAYTELRFRAVVANQTES